MRVKMPALIYSLPKPACRALFWGAYALSMNPGIASDRPAAKANTKNKITIRFINSHCPH
jgi:hypothetical protein